MTKANVPYRPVISVLRPRPHSAFIPYAQAIVQRMTLDPPAAP